MPIRWDSPLLRAVALELTSRLEGDRLRAVRLDRATRGVTLFFRSATLHWALHPDQGWVVLLPPTPPSSDAFSLPARITRVDAPHDERWIRLEFRRLRGTPRLWEVVVELQDRPWNALILEGEHRIVRRLLHPRAPGVRPLLRGLPYRPPPPSTRVGIEDPRGSHPTAPSAAGPRESPDGTWAKPAAVPPSPSEEDPPTALLRTARQEGDPRLVLNRLAYASSLNISALLADPPSSMPRPPLSAEAQEACAHPPLLEPEAPLPLPHDPPPEPIGLWGLELWERLRTLERPLPCILETTRGEQPYPFPLYGLKFTLAPNLLEAMLRVARSGGPLLVGKEAELRTSLEEKLQRARRKVRVLEEELASAEHPALLRERAHLILARLGEIPRGTRRLTLPGFDEEAVELELDPALSPVENAEVLFRRAARAEAARARLPELLAQARRVVQRLEEALESWDREDGTGALPSGGPPVGRPPQKDPLHAQAEPLPYRSYRSSAGREIRVGKGARQNDALTFRHSDPDDIWLHARDAAGAHVILRWNKAGTPPARDLEEAAVLAALASRARGSAVVPVDWTRRKYVRKPRKSPPGVVAPERVRTLFVRPDPGLPARLATVDQPAHREGGPGEGGRPARRTLSGPPVTGDSPPRGSRNARGSPS